MRRRDLLLLFASAAALPGQQKYNGPRPPKSDLPYLLHADNLVATEVLEAKEEKRKDDILYTIEGASSSAKTPLASPIFLVLCQKLQAERLSLYKFETRSGRREILFKRKNPTRPLLLTVNRLTGDGLYRVEAAGSLENGEYSLTPEGSNQVFCFQVY